MSWDAVPLSSVSRTFADGDWVESKDQSPEGIRLVQTGNVGEGLFKDRRDKARFISPETFARLNCTEVLPGDVLVSRLPHPVGRSCIVPATGDKMITAVDCTIVRPKADELDQDYLVYYTQSRVYQRDIEDRCTGTTRKRISRKNLGLIPIPLPPLEEQKRIVAVLDQAFAALDRARALAEANLADAEELFVRSAQELFDHDDGKTWKTIGDVCRVQSGAGFPKKEQGRTSGEYPFYKVSDMNLEGNEWSLSRANHYIDEAARKRLGAAIFPTGAIVFPKVGGAISTNKKRVVEQAGCVDNNVMGLIPNPDEILPEYVHEWLWAFDIYEFSNKAALPSITQTTVKGWPISIPAMSEQSKIVSKIQYLRNKIADVTNRHTDDLKDLADLRQSILQKAFAGELT